MNLYQYSRSRNKIRRSSRLALPSATRASTTTGRADPVARQPVCLPVLMRIELRISLFFERFDLIRHDLEISLCTRRVRVRATVSLPSDLRLIHAHILSSCSLSLREHILIRAKIFDSPREMIFAPPRCPRRSVENPLPILTARVPLRPSICKSEILAENLTNKSFYNNYSNIFM